MAFMCQGLSDHILEAQLALEEGRILQNQKLNTAEKRVYLLSGIIRCDACGHVLKGQTSHGKNKAHRYYKHSKIDKKDKACSVKNLRADDVATAILTHLDEILTESGYLNKIERNIKKYLMSSNNDIKKKKD